MVFSQLYYGWNQHWEGLFLICLKDIKEIIVLKEAHGPVGNLQMDATNAPDDPLEQFWNQMFYFIYFTNFEHLLKFGKEKRFLDAVGEWPVLQETFKKRYG